MEWLGVKAEEQFADQHIPDTPEVDIPCVSCQRSFNQNRLAVCLPCSKNTRHCDQKAVIQTAHWWQPMWPVPCKQRSWLPLPPKMIIHAYHDGETTIRSGHMFRWIPVSMSDLSIRILCTTRVGRASLPMFEVSL